MYTRTAQSLLKKSTEAKARHFFVVSECTNWNRALNIQCWASASSLQRLHRSAMACRNIGNLTVFQCLFWPPTKNASKVCTIHPLLGKSRDHFVYATIQLEKMLQCNIFSNWIGAYTELSFGIHWSQTDSPHKEPAMLFKVKSRYRMPIKEMPEVNFRKKYLIFSYKAYLVHGGLVIT